MNKIELNIEPFDFDEFDLLQKNLPKKKNNLDELQRNDDWLLQRNGSWNGSEIKGLMSCARKGGRKSWNDNDKVYDFSDGAIKFIYEVAMKRRTNRVLSSSSTKEMQYGTKIEPLIFDAVKSVVEIDSDFILERVGYKRFEDVPTAGVSSDAVIRNRSTLQTIKSVEMKACCSWGTHYERTFERTNDSSIDFWQTQSQMLAWGVKKTIYAVAEPPSDIMKYIRCENIYDLQDEWNEKCKISLEEILASEIHQNAILKRIQIAEKVIEKWNSNGGDLRSIFYRTIDDFKGIILIKASDEINDDSTAKESRPEGRQNKLVEPIVVQDENMTPKSVVDIPF